MRKQSSLMLVFVLLFATVLAACGNSGSGGGTASKNGGKDAVTINVFQFKVEFKKQFEAMAQKYMDKHPNVKINIETVGGGNDYGQALKAKIASKNEPDIFNIGGPEDLKQHASRLADLSDVKATKNVIDEALLAPVQKDGKTYGIPMNQEGYGLIYNKEIFKKAGVKAEDIKTLDDLEKVTKKIDSQKDKLGLSGVFALPGKEKWVLSDHGASMFLASDFDNDIKKAAEAKTLPFTHKDLFKQYLDIQNKYSKQPVASLDYSQQVEELFSTGKVAMIQQGNWAYPTIADVNPELADKVGLIAVPTDSKELTIPVGVANNWAVNKKSDEKVQKAAKDFLDWLYTSDEGKEIVMKDFKFIPAYKGYDSSKIADPLSKEIYKYSKEGKTTAWVFKGYPTGYTDDALGAYLQDYLTGKMSFDEAIKKSQDAWAKARK
ncbi:ABC transporter substrate-binding protein [Macrococcus equipercicus]|uniref:Carbohydrate ABC transporter substrate-binding protein n=1 Tax=Macrococcus equipercicus TaxID=69967 RepID=A0A9Q9BVL0_9STAP|nr:ABC transporter substrate-binding protein [Macrococcus equipercicus]UTH13982.1 carbohydrate ABC transporter substrate-binding protein [Macrococcus equipercicus]